MFKSLLHEIRTATSLQRARWSTTAIMILAAYVSFDHQRAFLLGWGANTKTSIIVPITVDLLAITCNIIVHIPDVSTRGFVVSLIVLIAAVGASGTANFYAGENMILKIANLWTVVAYLLSEFVTASAKTKVKEKNPVRVEAGKKAAETTRTRKATPKAATSRKRGPKPPASAPTSPAWVVEGRQPSAEEAASISIAA